MAKKYEDFFRSEADGLEISVLCICPEEKPYRAIVQLVHGMCEHKERYIPFMEYLAEQKEKMIQAVKYGASEFITKPYESDEVERIIAQILD